MKLLFYDHGNNLALAELAARQGHSVSYYIPPTDHYWKHVPGAGIKGITKVDTLAPMMFDRQLALGHPSYFDAADTADFTFGADTTLQQLERDRGYCRNVLRTSGVRVQSYSVVKGMPDLLATLAKTKNKYVKVSRYRDIETFFHKDWPTTMEQFLPRLLNAYGMDPEIGFIIEDRIESDVEVGSDDIIFNGRPNVLRPYGYEAKDAAYIGCCEAYGRDLIGTTDELVSSDVLANAYSFFSVERRGIYTTDITARTPWPPTAALMHNSKNLIDVLTTGAEWKVWCKYCACLVLSSGWLCEHAVQVEVSDRYRDQVILQNYFSRDGKDRWCCPTGSSQDDTLGFACACADRIDLLRPLLMDVVSQIKAKDLRYDIAAFDQLIEKTIPLGRVAGIPF